MLSDLRVSGAKIWMLTGDKVAVSRRLTPSRTPPHASSCLLTPSRTSLHLPTRPRNKVGTARNIAAACDIVPLDAELLELTAETFPVLSTVRTARLLDIQLGLEAARPQPSALQRLGCHSQLPPHYIEPLGRSRPPCSGSGATHSCRPITLSL